MEGVRKESVAWHTRLCVRPCKDAQTVFSSYSIRVLHELLVLTACIHAEFEWQYVQASMHECTYTAPVLHGLYVLTVFASGHMLSCIALYTYKHA